VHPLKGCKISTPIISIAEKMLRQRRGAPLLADSKIQGNCYYLGSETMKY